MIFRNRKGFLLGEFTLKVIVAIICIGLLAFLLIKLFGVFKSGETEIDKAKATIDRVIERASDAVLSPDGRADYILLEPKGWVLVYYGETHKEISSCISGKCLCLCPAENAFNSQLSKCLSGGVCKSSSVNIIFNNNILIDKSVPIVFTKQPDGVLISG